ncbi:MAG: right-handed parallel beta-helix repeat-containing protein, partial [Candidatus Riesia sp.]|nr:right-handed parallel beta-helix repeat-containing protein [Candidatus Riesia sp.]
MATRLLLTVKQSGGDFTSLSAAISYLQSNYPSLVSSDVYVDIEISGTWTVNDTNYVIINSITTDATHYINIYTTGSSRHQGKLGSNHYKLVVNNYNIHALRILVANVIIDGLAISATNSNHGIVLPAYPVNPSNCTIRNNIVYGCANTGILAYGGDVVVNPLIYNNIVYDCVVDGIYHSGSSNVAARIYNNTCYGNANYGIRCQFATSNVLLKNNLCVDNVVGDILPVSATTENNATADTSGDAPWT